ncbi:MAG: rhombosortase, partial [Gammaproteobacteria bacterium]|nr:rhombosortase [Gammaproteobacteria bacterium]
GELWRLLTGHLAHLGWTHLLLNGAGLGLVWCLVAGSLSLAGWALVVLLTIAGIDAGFLLLRPDLAWYVGLSGLLHGLLAAGLVAGFRARPLECVVIGLGLVCKLTYEQLVGPLPGSAETAGGAVIVAAHVYGASTGTMLGIAASIRRWRKS